MIKILLKQQLNGKKMTQAQLAEMAKIRPSTICDWCNNNTERIKIDHLEQICKALDCQISDILELF